MNSTRRFCLRLFGSPSIAGEDGALLAGRAAQRHRLALLALLALAPGRALSREKLMGYLWPERDTEHARQLLNQAVYHLRKALGEEAILSAGDDLRLNPEVIRADVAEFESALERDDPESAVALYRGPFLDGFFLSDAPEFEQWVDQERERLAGACAKALEALAEAAEENRDFGRAVERWKARSARDPYDSRVALRLMQALEASGNRAGALQHSTVHQRLLQEEFGAEPDPAVLALAERLRSEPAVRLEPSPELLPPAAPAAPVASTEEEAPELAENGAPVPPLPATASPPPPRQRPAVRYALAVLVLGAVLFGLSWLGSGGAEMPPTAVPVPSIAVLPLANLSTDPGDAALADGMTEELIAMLAKTGGLRVIASTSVSGFRGRQLDARTIADSLQVAYILEGGLQKIGSRLRVQVRLVDGRDGSTRWSETFDREMQDVFAVQDDIARAVTRELGLRLAGANGTLLRRPHTQNVAAYELYLRGTDRTLLRSDSAAREGLEYLRQAIALDSTYAAAWAGLGRMYLRLTNGVRMTERERYYALAEEAARNALALDDSLAEAHATLGLMRMTTFDFAAAERHLTRAIELDPTRALTHEWMVTLYLWTGRPEQALAYAQRALELDPLSPYAHAEVARALLFNDRCDEALAHLEELANLQPPLLRVAPIAAQCYARKQMWPEAIGVLRPHAERGGTTGLALLGYTFARAGQKEEALRIHATLLARSRRGDGGAFPVALVYAGLGDLDQAFAWLDRSIDDRSLSGGTGDPAPLMLVSPLLEDLRRDPRFEPLRERLGLQKR
jgi:DNA-binding SARP family transcriptional activator/TolB-like protein